jgi:1,4-dihydroxy-2-naphthoyl-CoA hydrolase
MDTLDDILGFELLALEEASGRARVVVTDRVRQPYGIVHGGTYAALAESLTSAATDQAVGSEGIAVLGLSNLTSFLRPVREGTVNAEAIRLHRGRTTWVWDVRMTDDEGRLCATSRVTIAVRPTAPPP